MERIPLKEYKKPRILAVDFNENEVKKIKEARYAAKRAFTGLYDGGEFCIPASIKDIEIVLFNYKKGTFDISVQREKHKESIPDGFDFHLVVKETFDKGGWLILYIGEDSNPDELEYLNINNLGFTWTENGYVAASQLRRSGCPPIFPKFKGETIKTIKYGLGNLLKRFHKSANWILLTDKKDIKFVNTHYKQNWIITDDAAFPSALAIELEREYYEQADQVDASGAISSSMVARYSGIIILPDFGEKNADVALTIIQEYLYDKNPKLYSEPMHEWLSDHRPEPVKQLLCTKIEIEEKMKSKIEEINEKIKQEESKYSWLDMLLIGLNDDFKDSVGMALRFLGFKVEDIDKNLLPEKRKREDFNLTDPSYKSFYIVEAKATKRGASEDFITKTQNHKATYSREHDCFIPDAILVVNHSYNLEPIKRSGRFYNDSEVLERLKEQHIKAIDSVVLHTLCQKVLAKELTKEKAREFIKNITGACSNYGE
jgi:hypothetical protein